MEWELEIDPRTFVSAAAGYIVVICILQIVWKQLVKD